MSRSSSAEEAKVKPKSEFQIWKRILVYCRAQAAGLTASLLLSLLITAAALAQPRLMQLAVDACLRPISAAARLEELTRIVLLYGAAAAVVFAAGFVQTVLLEQIGQAIMHRLRSTLHRHLLSLDLTFFDAHPAGRLVTRLTNDIQSMYEMFTSVLVTLFNEALKLVGILAVLCLTNVRLALLMAAFLPLSLATTALFSRFAREGFRAARSQLAVVNAFLQEMVSAVGVIQLYGQETAIFAKFKRLNQEHLRRNLHLTGMFAAFMPLTEFYSSLAVALLLWHGGGSVLRRQLTLGELTAFLAYMRLFFQPLQELARKYVIVQSALASAERVFELLDMQAAVVAPAQPLPGGCIRGEIRFEQVCFAYPQTEEQAEDQRSTVLRHIDLHIRLGETVAVIGPTGAGKSTLVSLLVRFYDPDAGRILLDGHDLRAFAPETLRRKIGIVLQDALVEPDTVLANIRQDSDLSREEVSAMLARAGLNAFVGRLPQGLDTRIGEGGLDLSAGEKQLLAFARVFCRDPAVLILDEATSSVDTEAENLLEQTVRRSFAGRTVLVIAHRLATVRRADRIVVLDQGRIVEQGSPTELRQQQGLFSRLARFSASDGCKDMAEQPQGTK